MLLHLKSGRIEEVLPFASADLLDSLGSSERRRE